MSELQSPVPAQAEPSTAAASSEGASVTAGTMIKAARIAQGMHIAALATAIKVPVRKLEQLEADRYDALHEAAFVRALAMTVCRALKMAPGPVLAKLPEVSTSHLDRVSHGLNAPFREDSPDLLPSWLEILKRPVTLVVLVLIVAALILLFLPQLRGQPPGATASKAEAVAADPALDPPATPALPAAPVPQALPAAAGNALVVTAPVHSPASSEPSAPAGVRSAPPPGGNAPQKESTSSARPTGVPIEATQNALVFRASAEAWIEVRDAKGQVLLSRNLDAGAAAALNSGFPLNVVVGNAAATQIWLRGKPFDLKAVSRENVARFELK